MRLVRLTLCAPLQSWGEQARWDHRDTAAMPTKSGIIGLLGCCLGYHRGDDRLRALSEQLYMAVRADAPGRVMTDYHTVQAGDGEFLNAAGKPRGDTLVTTRQYLQGARFTVFLFGDDAVLQTCFDALSHPVWSPYLGRKCCVPALPIVPKWIDAASVEEALKHLEKDEQALAGRTMAVQLDISDSSTSRDGDRVIERRDHVRDASLNLYDARRVRAFYVKAGV